MNYHDITGDRGSVIRLKVLSPRSILAAWDRAGEAHCVAAPSALIGASNFFELAVEAAISLFGFDSGAALATVVGVLIEVPVMLSVVKIVNNTRGWYEAGNGVRQRVASHKAGG